MINEYGLSNVENMEQEMRRDIPVVNVCSLNGVESGIPEEERKVMTIEKDEMDVVYTEALTHGTANPVLVGIPHSGEFVPKEILSRITKPKAFVDGLDVGTAYIFSPKKDEKYVAVRNKISRLTADPNRGPRQFRQGKGVGGVTWTTNMQQEPIYRSGEEPTEEEMAKNVQEYYVPYYRALHALLASLHEKMGYQEMLFVDGHSFPGTVDSPQYGLVGSEPKPMFRLGSRGGTKASPEVMKMFVDALVRNAPAKEEFPLMYEHISKVAHEESEFGWGGALNVDYFGFPEGVNAKAAIGSEEKVGFKINAIQVEINSSAFYKDGKYNHANLDAIRNAVQKTIAEVGEKLKQIQS